jgi:predicted Zn finger-like uncharacterized protein
MVLATQCPFCQTTFRVANDQLKLRAGLVRCGHCNEVFDGNAHLLPEHLSEHQSAGNWPMLPPAPPPPTITPAIARANAAAPNYGAPPAAALPDPDTMAEIQAAWDPVPSQGDFSPYPPPASTDAADALMIEGEDARDASSPAIDESKPEPELEPEPAAPRFDAIPLPLHPSTPWQDDAAQIDDSNQGFPRIGQDAVDARFAEFSPEDEIAHHAAAPERSGFDRAENAEDAEEAEDAAEQPDFIRKAQRRERWARAGHVLTIACCVLLVFAAMAQSIYLGRNRIVAALPSLKPLLAAACLPLNCTVGLQRQIDQLSIESNELQAAVPGEPALTLSLLLRSRGDTALAWPHIELTLNDDDEKPLIRRVFAPAEYLPAAQMIDAGIAPDAEQPIKLSFTLTQGTASGYRVYLFYP